MLSAQVVKFNARYPALGLEVEWCRESDRTWFVHDAWSEDIKTGLRFREVVAHVQDLANWRLASEI